MLFTVVTATFLTLSLSLTNVSAASTASADPVPCWTYCRDRCCTERCYDTYRIFTTTAPTCYDNYLTCCKSCDCANNPSCDDKCRAKEIKCRKPAEKKLIACEKCCGDLKEVVLSGKNADEKCAKRYAKCQDQSTVFESCTGSADDGTCVI